MVKSWQKLCPWKVSHKFGKEKKQPKREKKLRRH